MTGEDVVAAARVYLGVPFKHQGRTPPLALDCAGLFIVICKDLGLDAIDISGYGRTPYEGMLEQHADDQPILSRVQIADMQPGDIMLMRFGKSPQHVAIYAGKTMIHAYEHSGKVVEHRVADVWKSRIVRAYRFKGIS